MGLVVAMGVEVMVDEAVGMAMADRCVDSSVVGALQASVLLLHQVARKPRQYGSLHC